MDRIREKLAPILEKPLIDEIVSYAEIETCREGDVLMDYGRDIFYIPLILSGTLRVMRRDEEDREILLYYLGNNETCAMAYSCCMEARKSEVKAVAEDTVEYFRIPHEKLDEWLCKYPSWKSYVFNSFSHRFNELLRSLESVAFHKLDQRLIQYLKTKSKIAGRSAVILSHQQIAEELGTSRVVISRLLKQLENDKKLILYRNEIKLLTAFFNE